MNTTQVDDWSANRTNEPLLEMSGFPGGLNGSLQHQLEVYFVEFKRPNPLAGIDSKKTLS